MVRYNLSYRPIFSVVGRITSFSPEIQESVFGKLSTTSYVRSTYIKFDTTNYPTNRPLRFEFMVNSDGIIEYYQDDLTFMIK